MNVGVFELLPAEQGNLIGIVMGTRWESAGVVWVDVTAGAVRELGKGTWQVSG